MPEKLSLWISWMMRLNYRTILSAARLIAIFAGLVLIQSGMPSRAFAGDNDLAQLEQLLAEKDYDQAAEIGRRLDDQSDASVDLTLPLARLARSLQHAEKLEASAEFYQRAVRASERPAAGQLGADKVHLVRLAAGAVQTQVNQLAEALETISPLFAEQSSASDSQKEMGVTILLRIGATALAIGKTDTASKAYSLAAEYASGGTLATAILGEAWASAIQGDDPVSAARKLAGFIDTYPDHVDASRAARACAECLKQAGRDEDSSIMLADLLTRWPDSDSALEVVVSHRDLTVDLVPSAVKRWLIDSVASERSAKFDAQLTVLAMLSASQEKELTAWAKLAKHLASIDVSGQNTSDLLMKLTESTADADAERLATIMIAPAEAGSVQAGAREAACRWAGRTERWSMLALAAESEQLENSDRSRTMAVERLFAEALMQVGRVDEASRWWNHLVDTRHANDFSTLLRCAEAETSVGQDAGVAESRIASARSVADEDRFQQSLVDLLDAELSIRRSQFDRARGLLEQVVRMNAAEASLRGRAQWLIGETHYLQRDFRAAIEAYRRVEGIDPGGMWVSASLIQAGKSFEQLGRTREAAVCYGNLLSRFADTSHADLARRRLAAISPETAPSIQSSPSSIRR